jgi:hypothetical protein
MSMASEVITPKKLTTADRCDRCLAQAHGAWDVKGSELLFCAHHDREFGPKLLEAGHVQTVEPVV